MEYRKLLSLTIISLVLLGCSVSTPDNSKEFSNSSGSEDITDLEILDISQKLIEKATKLYTPLYYGLYYDSEEKILNVDVINKLREKLPVDLIYPCVLSENMTFENIKKQWFEIFTDEIDLPLDAYMEYDGVIYVCPWSMGMRSPIYSYYKESKTIKILKKSKGEYTVSVRYFYIKDNEEKYLDKELVIIKENNYWKIKKYIDPVEGSGIFDSLHWDEKL